MRSIASGLQIIHARLYLAKAATVAPLRVPGFGCGIAGRPILLLKKAQIPSNARYDIESLTPTKGFLPSVLTDASLSFMSGSEARIKTEANRLQH